MAKRQKVKWAEAKGALTELREFSELIDKYVGFEREVAQRRPLGHVFAEDIRALREEQKKVREALYQRVDKIRGLVRAVFVEDFYEKNPHMCGPAVHRAIGIYDRMANGEDPPEAPVMIPPVDKPRRQISPLAVALIGLVTGGISGSGTAYVTARYGVRATCLAHHEVPCGSENGEPSAALCAEDGLGTVGGCMPLWKLRGHPAPSSFAPATSPPALSSSSATP